MSDRSLLDDVTQNPLQSALSVNLIPVITLDLFHTLGHDGSWD